MTKLGLEARWWLGFVGLTVFSLGLALALGNYVSHLREPIEVAEVDVGEWADLPVSGFEVRVEAIDAAPSFPSAWQEGEQVHAPQSMQLVRVQLTVRPLVGPEADMGCIVRLFNGDGEELTLTEYGVVGPESSNCSLYSDLGPRAQGVEFSTQTVWVVPSAMVDESYIEIHPLYADDRTFVTVRQR